MESVWCLIANVAGDEKHFSKGTKVYCFPQLWGDGMERMRILARHRGSPRLVEMVFPTSRMTGWRAREVFQPFVVERMGEFPWTEEKSKRAAAVLTARQASCDPPQVKGGENCTL